MFLAQCTLYWYEREPITYNYNNILQTTLMATYMYSQFDKCYSQMREPVINGVCVDCVN